MLMSTTTRSCSTGKRINRCDRAALPTTKTALHLVLSFVLLVNSLSKCARDTAPKADVPNSRSRSRISVMPRNS